MQDCLSLLVKTAKVKVKDNPDSLLFGVSPCNICIFWSCVHKHAHKHLEHKKYDI